MPKATTPTPHRNAVNFVWMGHLDTATKHKICAMGPASFATTNPDKPINMWVPNALLEQARDLFKAHPSIRVVSVDRMLNGEYGALKHIKIPSTHAHTYSEAGKCYSAALAIPGKYHNYAAQKDLASNLVISQYGGYFFDCSTVFERAISLPHVTEYRVTTTSTPEKFFKATHQNADLDWMITALLGTDIWAFAGIAGNAYCVQSAELMAQRYLAARNRGACITGGIDPEILHDNLKELKDIEAVKQFFNTHTLQTILINDPKDRSDRHHAIAAIGLKKYHLATWRSAYSVPMHIPKKGGLFYSQWQRLGLLSSTAESTTTNERSGAGAGAGAVAQQQRQ